MKRILLFAALLSSVCYVEASSRGGGKAKNKSTQRTHTGAAVSYLGAATAERVIPRVPTFTAEEIKAQTKTPYFRTPNNIQFLDKPGTPTEGQKVLTAATTELQTQTALFLAKIKKECASFAAATDQQRVMIATLTATISSRHQDQEDIFTFDKAARAEGMNPLDTVTQDLRSTLLEVVENLKQQNDAVTALMNSFRGNKKKQTVFANRSDFARSILQKFEREAADRRRAEEFAQKKSAAKAERKAKAEQLKTEIEAAAAAIEAASKTKKKK